MDEMAVALWLLLLGQDPTIAQQNRPDPRQSVLSAPADISHLLAEMQRSDDWQRGLNPWEAEIDQLPAEVWRGREHAGQRHGDQADALKEYSQYLGRQDFINSKIFGMGSWTPR